MGSTVGDLSKDDRKYLREVLCDDADVELRKCVGSTSKIDSDIMTILLGGGKKMSEKGKVWDGCVDEDGNPAQSKVDKKAGKPITSKKRNWWVPPDAGTSDKDLQRVFDLNTSADSCWDIYNKMKASPHAEDRAAALPFRKDCMKKAWDQYYGRD